MFNRGGGCVQSSVEMWDAFISSEFTVGSVWSLPFSLGISCILFSHTMQVLRNLPGNCQVRLMDQVGVLHAYAVMPLALLFWCLSD